MCTKPSAIKLGSRQKPPRSEVVQRLCHHKGVDVKDYTLSKRNNNENTLNEWPRSWDTTEGRLYLNTVLYK